MSVRGLLSSALPLAALVLLGCSNGNANSTEHGYLYEAGADTNEGADSMGLGDVIVVPGQDGGTDTGVADSTVPVDSAPTDTASPADTASEADAITEAGADTNAPPDSGPDGAGPDASGDTGTLGSDTGADSASEAGVDGGDAGCTSTMAIVGGSGSNVVATTWSGGAWANAQTLSGSVLSVPGLVSTGSAYVGVVRETTTNYLAYTVSGPTWSTPAPVPAAGTSTATTIGPPALAAIGGAAHLVYIGTDFKFYHGTYASNAWTPADDPVQSGAVQTFGPSAPTATGLAPGLTIVQAGMDSHVYAQPWDGTWGAPVQVATDADNVVSPRVALLTGGTASQMVVYARSDNSVDNVLMYSVLTGAAWSTPLVVHDTTVFTPNTVSIAPLPNGAALLVYQGSNGQPYFTTYNPASATPWTAAAPLLSTGNPTLTSPPQIAPGVCGALAVIVMAKTSSDLSVSTFTGAAWSDPTLLSGTSGATFAAIATQP